MSTAETNSEFTTAKHYVHITDICGLETLIAETSEVRIKNSIEIFLIFPENHPHILEAIIKDYKFSKIEDIMKQKSRRREEYHERYLWSVNIKNAISQQENMLLTTSGLVWVPPMTKSEIAMKTEYWDKFKVAKKDNCFKEVVERFQKKAVDKKWNLEPPDPVLRKSKSSMDLRAPYESSSTSWQLNNLLH